MGFRCRREPMHPLIGAARSITHAPQQLLEATPPAGELPPEQLRDTRWQVVHLTGELAETLVASAQCLDEHGRSRLVRIHDGGDPGAELARAARQLAILRQVLEHADAAGRDYRACVSRVVADADPTVAEQSTPTTRGRGAAMARGEGRGY